MSFFNLVQIGLDEQRAADRALLHHADELTKLGAVENDIETSRACMATAVSSSEIETFWPRPERSRHSKVLVIAPDA